MGKKEEREGKKKKKKKVGIKNERKLLSSIFLSLTLSHGWFQSANKLLTRHGIGMEWNGWMGGMSRGTQGSFITKGMAGMVIEAPWYMVVEQVNKEAGSVGR